MQNTRFKIFKSQFVFLFFITLRVISQTSCQTSALTIRTGWNYNTSNYFPVGALDPYWTVVADDDPSTTEPRLAYICGSYYSGAINSGYAGNAPNNWCCASYTNSCTSPPPTTSCTSNPNFYVGSPPSGSYPDAPRVMNFTFCIAPGTNLSALTLTYTIRADDYAKVCLNGNFIGSSYCPSSATCTFTINNPSYFQTGTNTISVSSYNLGGSVTYFLFDGSLTTSVTGVQPFSEPYCCVASKMITGQKFWDKNLNGIKDAGDSNIPGWTIYLKDNQNNLISSTQTDATGNYYFNNLTLNSYIVTEGTQTGFYPVYPTTGSYLVNLTGYPLATNIDFGNASQPCCTSGFSISSTGFQNLLATSNPTVYTAGTNIGNTLTLTPHSCSGVTSYIWDFGDGSIHVTSTSTVSHTYQILGNYTITVNAVGSSCYQSVIICLTVSTISPCCTNGFVSGLGFSTFQSGSTTSAYNATVCPLTNFSLSANCANATSYHWDFGYQSNTASGSNVTFQYPATSSALDYYIVVTASGPNCSQNDTIVVNSSCFLGFSNVSGVINFNKVFKTFYTGGACLNNATVSFTPQVCSGADTLIWNWGDGSPNYKGLIGSHTYSSVGTKTLTLSSTGASGCIPTSSVQLYIGSCTCPSIGILVLSGSPCNSALLSASSLCNDVGVTYKWSFGDGTQDVVGVMAQHTYANPGIYNITLSTYAYGQWPPATSTQSIMITACQTVQTCSNCIGDLQPEPGDYIISLWVHQDQNPLPLTFNFPKVQISFLGNSSIYTFGTNLSKNQIIDGWQKIEEPFTISPGTTDLFINLINQVQYGGPDAYFDDIRIIPKDAQMKSFVYDPFTLRLSAMLDENNYATFYEYNEEGKLVRVKKETEKGIMTLQENRESLKKK